MITTATSNPVLTSLLVQFMQEAKEFAALKVMPPFYSALKSASYYVFNKENMLNVPRSIRRGPDGTFGRTRMLVSDQSFNCQEWGQEVPVDDEDREKYAFAFDADKGAVNRLGRILMVAEERRVVALTTSTLAGVNPAALWDDYATSNPVADIKAARRAIHAQIGLMPNLLVLPLPVFDILCEHPVILNKIKYTQGGFTTEEILAKAFNMDEIVVAGALDNNANEGQVVNPYELWGSNVLLARTDNSQDMSAPSWARTFMWTKRTGPNGVVMESYREENKTSDIHRFRQSVSEAVQGSTAAYLFTNVISGGALP